MLISGDNLHSFVCSCNYYSKFYPLFQLKVIPLRYLYICYTRKKIPANAWTQELLLLFESLKNHLTSSSMLVQYDSSLLTFLKTNWSASGIGFIIMQPNTDNAFLKALKVLQTPGDNTFDVSLKGERIRPILFGSRKCTETESHYHSFVGEISTGRWGYFGK